MTFRPFQPFRGFGGGAVLSIPVISGTAYPAETLTSTIAGQWYADDVSISGETGSTYIVRLDDIGRVIRCGDSNTLTVWKPGDISAVKAFWTPYRGVLNTVGPDVAATDGQAVRRWVDQIAGYEADQATEANRPIYRATGQSSNPALEFDGADDRLTLSGAAFDLLRNIDNAYIIAGGRDTNRTAGSAIHNMIGFNVGTSISGRLVALTRSGGSNVFAAGGRRLDANSFAQATETSNADYNVISAHGDYGNGFFRLRRNGSLIASTAASGGAGSTSDTASTNAGIGAQGTNSGTFFPGFLTPQIVVTGTITATDLSKLERYVGLFGGLNIAIV
jgi:hypothetical protein